MCRQPLSHIRVAVLLSCRQSQARHRPPPPLLRHPQSRGSFQRDTAQTASSARAKTCADSTANAISESRFRAELQRQHHRARRFNEQNSRRQSDGDVRIQCERQRRFSTASSAWRWEISAQPSPSRPFTEQAHNPSRFRGSFYLPVCSKLP